MYNCITSSPRRRVLHNSNNNNNNILQYHSYISMEMHGHFLICYNVHIPPRFRTFSGRRILASGTRALRCSQSKALQKSRRSWHKFHRRPSLCHGKNQHGNYCLISLNILNPWWFQDKFNNIPVGRCGYLQASRVSSLINFVFSNFDETFEVLSRCQSQIRFIVSISRHRGSKRKMSLFFFSSAFRILWFGGKYVQPTSRWTQRMVRLCRGMAAGSELFFFCFLFWLIFFNSSLKSERSWMLLMVFMFFSEAEIREDVGRRSFWSLHRANDFQAESLQTCFFPMVQWGQI